MTAKNQTVVMLACATLVGAVLQQVFDPLREKERYWTIVTTAVPLFFVFRWYLLDAAEHGFERSRLFDVLVVAAACVVLPWYFFRTRGAIGGLRATLVCLLGLVALGGLGYAASYCIYLLQVRWA